MLGLASEAGDPEKHRVLDVGAGTGRNALGLARRGYPVDAVELTPKFADIIRTQAERELLDVRVIQRDVFSTLEDLRQDYQLIVLSEVVSDFRTTLQLRGMFELATHCLAPGGRLVFNAFLAHDGYTPDDATRELGNSPTQACSRAKKWPLRQPDYRCHFLPTTPSTTTRAQLPEGAWPPTSWYPIWTSGQDVFDIERERCRSSCAGWLPESCLAQLPQPIPATARARVAAAVSGSERTADPGSSRTAASG